jgi:hypothetical protein
MVTVVRATDIEVGTRIANGIPVTLIVDAVSHLGGLVAIYTHDPHSDWTEVLILNEDEILLTTGR